MTTYPSRLVQVGADRWRGRALEIDTVCHQSVVYSESEIKQALQAYGTPIPYWHSQNVGAILTSANWGPTPLRANSHWILRTELVQDDLMVEISPMRSTPEGLKLDTELRLGWGFYPVVRVIGMFLNGISQNLQITTFDLTSLGPHGRQNAERTGFRWTEQARISLGC